MKIFCILTCLTCFFLTAKPQSLSSCDSANLDCHLDLTQPIFTDIHIDTLSYAKHPLPSLFLDVQYEKDAYGKPTSCLPPASGMDECLNDSSSLIYYAYYPKDHNYTGCPLKPIILMHSGGFAECSSFDQPGINNMAMFLAQKGFVVFNVEYDEVSGWIQQTLPIPVPNNILLRTVPNRIYVDFFAV